MNQYKSYALFVMIRWPH